MCKFNVETNCLGKAELSVKLNPEMGVRITR